MSEAIGLQGRLSAPSAWIVRWSHLLEPQCSVLDVACGSGRHLAWFLQRGHAVTGVDRDLTAARHHAPSADLIEADIEQGAWPLMEQGQLRTFGAVVVTNYLWRPLLETWVRTLAPGGVLMYETFARGQDNIGRPSRPDYLLDPGELWDACKHLHVIAYENGLQTDSPRMVQRIVALRPLNTAVTFDELKRHAL
ncbi:class I SAM-dependent methyltransferase [Rhodoferax aquaticus]|uniref:Class I SAM-dependent methyltransferase n=1 Tax=Rhodoferax aquaticus TaxID=2527691 RepID=A0A515EMN2_9BURK|nr:class I SAM-dependent methyltransferase [Rhodoferax aquaticus]QDL53913.1 class I SAM-dependent methyltransferase [Rhodoferax aquaticus]